MGAAAAAWRSRYGRKSKKYNHRTPASPIHTLVRGSTTPFDGQLNPEISRRPWRQGLPSRNSELSFRTRIIELRPNVFPGSMLDGDQYLCCVFPELLVSPPVIAENSPRWECPLETPGRWRFPSEGKISADREMKRDVRGDSS